MLHFSMKYRYCDMIYGIRRMIYLLCKYDIISVPSYAAGIYHRTIVRYHTEDISPVPSGTDIIEKDLFCQIDKRGLFHGAGYGNRTRLHGLGSRCITDIRTLRLCEGIIAKPFGKCNLFLSKTQRTQECNIINCHLAASRRTQGVIGLAVFVTALLRRSVSLPLR